MRIGFLTTSRADFGIYLPLLRSVEEHPDLDYKIFAGGTHMSPDFGLTYELIEELGFSIEDKIASLNADDSPKGIAISMGETTQKFAQVWKKHAGTLDVLFVLGDRFEMFAAAAAAVPFNIPIAHLHGGEITLGSIDNKFRNAITSISTCHFVATEQNANRVSQIIGSSQGIHQVGALGVEGIQNTNLLSPEEFDQQFHFNILDPYVLLTYHPETVNLGENENYIQQLLEGLESIPEKVLCTMPNADTEGMIVREKLLKYERDNPDKIKCFENLGHIGYYTCMSYCKMMVGNTSSGIIEAASFDKPVVNIGDRQKGREVSGNVIHVNNVAAEIIDGYNKALELLDRTFENIYGDGKTSAKIVEILIGE